MKLYKNQSGALNPLVIVLIVVVLGAVGFAGYKVYDSNKSKDTASSSNSTASVDKETQELMNSECMKQYNDKDFCKFASNWSEMSKTYKAQYTNKDADGTVSTMSIEIDGENSSTVGSENGKEAYAYITLNKINYMKDYDANVWYKLPQGDTSATQDMDVNPTEDLNFDETTEAAEDKSTVKALGKEACGNQTCFKYQIIDPADTETTENLVWFDDKDYKLVRMQIVSKDGSSSDATFSYGEKVEIKEPSPVQEYNLDPAMLGQ